MASKVVSTKLTEEEYGKLVGLCSAKGYTVSKLLKRAILESMNEEPTKPMNPLETPKTKLVSNKKTQIQKNTVSQDDKYLYY